MMAQAGKRPSVPHRMYAELPSPLYNSKCISGENKPNVYIHRDPSDHIRRDYHQCRSYPLEFRKDESDTSDRTVDFRTAHDHSSGYYYHPGIGVCMCNDPSSRLNAYARDQPHGSYTRGLPALPGRPWPQWDAWISPYRRGRGKYYGWYYDPEVDGPLVKVPGAGKPHRELLHVQRPDPSIRVDPGYRSRWGFDQP